MINIISVLPEKKKKKKTLFSHSLSSKITMSNIYKLPKTMLTQLNQKNRNCYN